MKQSPVRILLLLLFVFIGCFGVAYAAAGMFTALPAPAIGGTCGPSTGSETAAEALAEPSTIGAGPEPPASNVTAHHQWQTFVEQCQTLADRRGLASLAVLVISLAVAGIGLFWVLRRPTRDDDGSGDDGNTASLDPGDGGGTPSYTPLGLHDPALVGAGAVVGAPSAAVAAWPTPPPPPPPGAGYPDPQAGGYPQYAAPGAYPQPGAYPPAGAPPAAPYANPAYPAPTYAAPVYPAPTYPQAAAPPAPDVPPAGQAWPLPGTPGYPPAQGYPPAAQGYSPAGTAPGYPSTEPPAQGQTEGQGHAPVGPVVQPDPVGTPPSTPGIAGAAIPLGPTPTDATGSAVAGADGDTTGDPGADGVPPHP